jgi:hypothetical protein
VRSPYEEEAQPLVVAEQPPGAVELLPVEAERMRVAVVEPRVVEAPLAVVAVHFLDEEEQLPAAADDSLAEVALPHGAMMMGSHHGLKPVDDHFVGWARSPGANSSAGMTIVKAGGHLSTACSHFYCLGLADPLLADPSTD